LPCVMNLSKTMYVKLCNGLIALSQLTQQQLGVLGCCSRVLGSLDT
jgi:hypothetical protein